MITLLVFAIALFAAVLVSELAHRSILSTAVIFLGAGFVCGSGALDLITMDPGDTMVKHLAEFALFSVLLTDGMRVSLGEMRHRWRLPARALGIGMPLTFFGTAAICHYLIQLTWLESLLIGAILSPTDPVFAAAIVGREEIPERLRSMLNVESGLNDGLALPLVLVFLALVSHEPLQLGSLVGELAMGVGIGVAIPWAACKIEQSRLFGVSEPYEPLFAFAVGFLVLGTSLMTHANLFLAAFATGVTLATMRSDLRDEFHEFGELITELLKLAALLVFGALISPAFLWRTPAVDYVAAVVILLVVRPAALSIALIRTDLSWRERITVGWFGPKGFASAIYGLLLYQHGINSADVLFHVVAVVVAFSIIAHSSTDVLIARWFREGEPKARETA